MTTQREMVESLAEETAEMLDSKHGKDLVRQADKVARKHGIDSGYLQYILARDPGSWPSFPGRLKEALEATVAITKNALGFEYEEGMVMPSFEDEAKVNAAIQELAKWSWEHRQVLRRDYFQLIAKRVRGEAKPFLEEVTGKRWTDRDTVIWLHGATKERVELEPAGIWRAMMLWRVLDLVL